MKDIGKEPSAETLSLDEAAALMHLGRESMKDLVDNGIVPALRLNKKHTVILRDELIAFIRNEGQRQAAERKAQHLRVQVGAKTRDRRRRALPDLAPYERGD